MEAKHQLQLRRVLTRWSRYDLIAIDEVGDVPLAEVGAEFLFQVIAERAERTAVILTTNLPFGMDTGDSQRAAVQSATGSHYRSSPYSGNRQRIVPIPPDDGKTKERSNNSGRHEVEMAVRGKRGKPKAGFPSLPTALGNPATAAGFPTFPQLRRLLLI